MRRFRTPSVGFAVAAGCALLCGMPFPEANAEGDSWGTVKGRVVLDGPVPARKEIAVTKDQEHCLGKGKIFSEEWVVNDKNQGVRWVFVWLAPKVKGTPLEVHPGLKEIKEKQAELDQPCCMFVPHALALREGQELLAKNSAPIAHNVHWTGFPTTNPGGNQIVPAKQSLTIGDLKADKYPVKISCDIHGWMNAWVRVFDHPYFALTDADGNFEIKLAPAGKCRLVTWHETGWGPGLKEGTPITIKGGGVTDVEIKLKVPKDH